VLVVQKVKYIIVLVNFEKTFWIDIVARSTRDLVDLQNSEALLPADGPDIGLPWQAKPPANPHAAQRGVVCAKAHLS
jgi:hypothetical protein